MKRFCCFMIFILIFTCGLSAQSSFAGYKKYFEKEFKSVSNIDTSDSDISLMIRAKNSRDKENYALDYLEKHQSAENYITLAKYFNDQNNYKDFLIAKEILLKGKKRFDDHERILTFLAFVYEKNSIQYKYKKLTNGLLKVKADDLYEDIADDFPESLLANYNVGRIFLERLIETNNETSLNRLQVTKINAGDLNIEQWLDSYQSEDDTQVYYDEGMYEDILEHWGKMTSRDTMFADFVNNFSRLCYETKHYDDGFEFVNKCIPKIRDNEKLKNAYLWLGIFNYKKNKVKEASEAFGFAKALMNNEEKLEYNLNSYKYPFSSNRMGNFNIQTQQQKYRMIRNYVKNNDPLFLTSTNELIVDHNFRVALSNFLFTLDYSENRIKMRGWNSNRGEILIRYGEPEKIFKSKLFIDNAQQSFYQNKFFLVWQYGKQRFVFTDNKRNGNYVFSLERVFSSQQYQNVNEDQDYVLNNLRRLNPTVNTFPSIKTKDWPFKIYNFKKDLNKKEKLTNLLFSYSMDYVNERNIDLTHQYGLFVFNKNMRQVYKDVREISDTTNTNSFTLNEESFYTNSSNYLLAPSSPNIALELMRDCDSTVLSRRFKLNVTNFNVDSLQISDILLANKMNFDGSGKMQFTRGSISMNPKPDNTFTANDSLYLYLEVYNIQLKNNLGSYVQKIELVEADEKEGLASFFNSLGLGSDNKMEISSNRAVTKNDDQIFLKIDMSDKSEGNYLLKVIIEDTNSGKTVSKEVRFTYIN